MDIKETVSAIYDAWYNGAIDCSEQEICAVLDAALEAVDKEDNND